MSMYRVAVLGGGTKTVLIDSSLSPRVTALEAALANLQLTGGPAQQHKNLGGLQVGDDHPQYTMWAAPERITGQWQFTKPIWASDGDALLPGYTWTLDPNTGFYRIGDDSIGATTGGTQRWSVDTTRVNQTLPLRIQSNSGFLLQNEGAGGFAGIEMLSFNGFDPAQECGNRLAFWESPARLHGFRMEHEGDIDVTGDMDFYRHNNSAPGVLFMRWTRDSSQVQFASGSATSPSVTVIDDTANGLYWPATDTVGIATNGVLRLSVDINVVTSTLEFRGPNGANTSPTYSFTGDGNTGMYRVGADNLGFATNSSLRLDISTTRITSTLPIGGPNGSNTAPTYSFSSDTGNGWYLPATDTVGVATNGVLRGSWSTTALRLVTDNYELQIGAGSDLRLLHDGTNSIIRNDTGLLRLYSASVTQDAMFTPNTDWSLTGATELGNFISERFLAVRAGTSSAPTFKGFSYGSTGTRAAPAALTSGDGIFALDGGGYDGTAFSARAFIRGFAGEAWSSTAHGTFYQFGTCALGVVAARTVVGVWSDGGVRLTLDNAELSIGAGSATTNNTTGDLRLYHDGTNSIIRNDTGALHLQFSTNVRFSVNTTGVSFNGQTPIARPDYTITNPTTNRSIDVSTITAANLAQVVGTMIQDLIDYGLYQ